MRENIYSYSHQEAHGMSQSRLQKGSKGFWFGVSASRAGCLHT